LFFGNAVVIGEKFNAMCPALDPPSHEFCELQFSEVFFKKYDQKAILLVLQEHCDVIKYLNLY